MKVVAYVFAGATLLAIAEVAPNLAVGTAGLILLASVLENPQRLTAFAGFLASSTR